MTMKAINSIGDPLLDKGKIDVWFISHNTHGVSIKEGLTVLPQTTAIKMLHLDAVWHIKTLSYGKQN